MEGSGRYSWVHTASTLITAVLPYAASLTASVSSHVQQGRGDGSYFLPPPLLHSGAGATGQTSKWNKYLRDVSRVTKPRWSTAVEVSQCRAGPCRRMPQCMKEAVMWRHGLHFQRLTSWMLMLNKDVHLSCFFSIHSFPQCSLNTHALSARLLSHSYFDTIQQKIIYDSIKSSVVLMQPCWNGC